MVDIDVDVLRKVMAAWDLCYADTRVRLRTVVKDALEGEHPLNAMTVQKHLTEALYEALNYKSFNAVSLGRWMSKHYEVEVDGRCFRRVHYTHLGSCARLHRSSSIEPVRIDEAMSGDGLSEEG